MRSSQPEHFQLRGTEMTDENEDEGVDPIVDDDKPGQVTPVDPEPGEATEEEE